MTRSTVEETLRAAGRVWNSVGAVHPESPVELVMAVSAPMRIAWLPHMLVAVPVPDVMLVVAVAPVLVAASMGLSVSMLRQTWMLAALS